MKGKMVMLVTYVPVARAASVRRAMGRAGAGIIGRYTHCSWSARGTGRFCAGKGSHPAVGNRGTITAVAEERIEMACERRLRKRVISAIKKAHPYEEVPIYVYPAEMPP